MTDVDETKLLNAARAGDQDAFRRLTDPYRSEILVHCYRMLGSLEDGEDILQETLLRAWHHLSSFEGRSSLRAWLYKIATNASLDALDSRRRRIMPATGYAPAAPGDPFPAPIREAVWIEALPDALIDERPATDPEARYKAHESVTLAFLATLQNLPGRQRAVLILRDVLGFSTNEAAQILGMTSVSVNSALQRARTTMKQHRSADSGREIAPGNDTQTASLLTRYVEAWETANSAILIALLREDATLTMPPLPLWYRGREDIRWFIDTQLFTGQAAGRFRLVATRANRCPAFAVYLRDEAGVYRPSALQVLSIENGQVAAIDDFLAVDERLFSRFGLSLVG